MSQENVEVVKSLLAAWQSGEPQRSFEFYVPDIEWDTTGLEGSLAAPDFQGVYRGHEGVREFWRGWLSAWESIDFEVGRITDAGDHVLMEITHQRNRGRRSGIDVELSYVWLFTLRDGNVTRVRFASTWEKAVEAVGLRE